MKTKEKVIQIMCIVFIFILATSTLALSEETELIWEIGERDGKCSEFNQTSTGTVSYSIGENYSKFPYELNDGHLDRTHIFIRYNLTDKQAKKGTYLSLCIANHSTNKSFGFSVSVNDIKIGDYSFRYESMPDSCKVISINKTHNSGKNVMLIENTNANGTNHWLNWDYLSTFEVVKQHRIA